MKKEREDGNVSAQFWHDNQKDKPVDQVDQVSQVYSVPQVDPVPQVALVAAKRMSIAESSDSYSVDEEVHSE